MRIALAGAGAFGIKHLDALARIDDVEVVCIVSRTLEQAQSVADQYGADQATVDLSEALERPDVDAIILCTPTQLHADQAIAALRAGKHVQVEIPLADSWSDAVRVARVAHQTGRTCMVGHTRRFNPSHQWLHQRITAGELSIQQMNVQTYFFRRSNTNAQGNPRSWTDNLLWHHAAHTVDLFAYQCGEVVSAAHIMAGPVHPDLGIPMDMSIQLQTPSGKLCTLSLSFNNEGPLGTFSATSATTGPTSLATTTSSPATTSRSTSRTSRCRWTGSNSRTGNSSGPSAKATSRTRQSLRCCTATRCSVACSCSSNSNRPVRTSPPAKATKAHW